MANVLKRDARGVYFECGPFELSRLREVSIRLEQVWKIRFMVLDPVPTRTLVMGMRVDHVEMFADPSSGCPAEFFSKYSTAPQLEFPVLGPNTLFSLDLARHGLAEVEPFFVRLYGFGPSESSKG